jgi:transposase
MENQEIHAEVILGVDTHLDVHVGVVIDTIGRVLGTLSVGTHDKGYQQLLCWAQAFGLLRRAGVEGTGSYGSALTQVLQKNGITVIEINRPDRTRRRGRGKSDATDAESAARSVLAGDANIIPKAHDGLAEGLRTLSLVRRSAVKAKTQSINQIRALLVSAPQTLRDAVYKTDGAKCIAAYMALTCDAASAALAALCGTSPLQASSGKTQRHRLNRGGNRQANNALWTIAMVRMRSDARTRQYVERRTGEGLSKKEIHRCLKRYIVRELYPLILADLKDAAFIT